MKHDAITLDPMLTLDTPTTSNTFANGAFNAVIDQKQDSDDEEEDEEDDNEPLWSIHFDLLDLSADINKPLQRPQFGRLRYTSFDVSGQLTPVLEAPVQYVALGTTSGSVYLFQCDLKGSLLSSPTETNYDSLTNSDQSFVSSPLSSLHHYLTIIQEDIVGSVTSLSFGPVELLAPTHTLSSVGNSHGSDVSVSDDFDLQSNHSSSCSSDIHSYSSPRPVEQTGSQPQQRPTVANLLLAIGTNKGHLLIAEFTPSTLESWQSNVFKSSYPNKAYNKQWKILYHCKTFTTSPISLIHWDDFDRLFVADSLGKLFVLHQIRELNNLILPMAPSLLLDLNGMTIFQLELCEQIILISTNEPRVYLFNMATSQFSPIGKASSRKKGNKERPNGVCILGNYQMVECDQFMQPQPPNVDDQENVSLYREENEALYGQYSHSYRLVNSNYQIFVTRPKWRLWVVDVEGRVQFTQQYHEPNESANETCVTGDQSAMKSVFQTRDQNLSIEPSLTNNLFTKLSPMYWYDANQCFYKVDSYLVTYSDTVNSRIFVIDPNQQTILAASPPVNGRLLDVCCVGKNIFFIYQSPCESVLRMSLLTLHIRQNQVPNDTSSAGSFTPSPMLQQEPAFNSELVTPPEMYTDLGEVNNNQDTVITTTHTNKTVEEPSAEDFDQKEMEQLLKKYSYELGFHDENMFSKCVCGLPLPDAVLCSRFQFVRMELLDQIRLSLSANMFSPLMELAYSKGNWTLYLYMLAKLNESKFYLYFALLFDDPCLVMRHQNLFGSDLLTDHEQLWQDIVEYVCHCIFSTQPQLPVKQALPGIKSYSTLESDLTSSSTLVLAPTMRCTLCQLKQISSDQQQLYSIVSWFEKRFLRYSLFYCSPSFVVRTLQKVMSNIYKCAIEPNSVSQCAPVTNLFSTGFYLLLLWFKILSLDKTNLCLSLIGQLQSGPRLRSTIGESRVTSLSTNTEPSTLDTGFTRGMVVQLNRANCAYCKKLLYTGKFNSNISRRQSSTRKSIIVYRKCGHLYHSACALTKRCWLCR